MSARATRRPKRVKKTSGRGFRSGGRPTDSGTPGCALILLAFVGLSFMAAGGVVLTAVLRN